MSPSQQEIFNSFHGDESLGDQTPEVLGLFESLPGGVAAAAQLLVHGLGDEGKRAAVAQLPMNHPKSKEFMAKGVAHYWNGMLHPPLSYLGEKFQYRSADGADNNILHPQLGKAGLPYAKSVPAKMDIHGARPDPGDLFDMLLARKDDQESQSGISSMLLYHATIIIHDIFRSNPVDKNISDTSSYLDLSPLYGHNQETQDTIRKRELGLLKPDSFAEKRLLMQPPGVCIYIIMYSRFHNYVAKQLLEINENGKFALPILEGSDTWNKMSRGEQQAMKSKQDEDLFQTARLITCGLYINISIHDYLKCLMGFHGKDTAWTLDPRIEIPGEDKTGVQRGIGNQVSVEFNLLYRFHSPISTRDRIWSENMFKTWLGSYKNKDGSSRYSEDQILAGDIEVRHFKEIIDKMNAKGETKEDQLAKERNLPFLPEGLEGTKNGYKFKRDKLGRFNDAELVAEMAQVIEDPICQFGAQNVPKIFKAIEILGILQARKWEVATLNEFREFFGLKRHKKFEDINEDSEIINSLRDLYESPDCVELYPGLCMEGNKRCLDPGTVGPNGEATALWSGVFCDAVTLVRSDRFYTVDWNVGSLTAWGMHEVTSDPDILKGSVFHRLFQRAFPGHFKYDSVHLWQPFYTPAMNIVLAAQQGYLPSLDLSDLHFDGELGCLSAEDPKFKIILAGKGYVDLRRKVRRIIPADGQAKTASKPSPLVEISNYSEIKDKMLGANKTDFRNPGTLNGEIIRGKYLRAMMMGESTTYDKAETVFEKLVTPETEGMFHDYFIGVSGEILARERRKFQRQPLYTFSFDEARDNISKLKLPHEVEKQELQKLDRLEEQIDSEKKKGNGTFDRFSTTVQKDLMDVLQVYQVDVVRDYAIPVITRFVADLLGFWDCVRTPHQPSRKYNENQIYQFIHDAQDYLTYHADETMIWKRREAFKKALAFLKEKAEYGVEQSHGKLFGMFSNKIQEDGDMGYVVKVREFGVKVIKALLKTLNDNEEEVAAVMLVLALDAAHKSVMTFTEVLAYFIDHPHEEKPDVSNWIAIQKLAFENTPAANEELRRYVLEAQRLRVDLPLLRVYKPTKTAGADKTTELWLTNAQEPQSKHVLKEGDRFLLQLKQAQQYEGTPGHPVFPNPNSLSLDPHERKLENYLVYGQGDPSRFKIKDLTLIGLTAMLKHMATRRDLRVAHDKLGRLKRAKTPDGVEHYMTIQWDQLVPFPTTWNLRFNGYGRGVYSGPDNADQGHGQNQVYQKPGIVPPGGSYKSGSGTAQVVENGSTQEDGKSEPHQNGW